MISNPSCKIHLAILGLALFIVTHIVAQDLPVTKPEELGFSSKRLERIDEAFGAFVKENKMAGSVILIARKGKYTLSLHDALPIYRKSVV